MGFTFVNAQRSTGTLSGRILDQTGALIPEVKITIEGKGFMQEIKSDEEGRYEISLAEGNYRIKAERADFHPSAYKKLQINPNKITTQDVVLVGRRVDEEHP